MTSAHKKWPCPVRTHRAPGQGERDPAGEPGDPTPGGGGSPAGSRSPRPGASARATRESRLLLGAGLLDVLGHHVLVRGEPVGLLLELAALHLPDLDESAALVILRRYLQRGHQPAQGEVRDLLEAGL